MTQTAYIKTVRSTGELYSISPAGGIFGDFPTDAPTCSCPSPASLSPSSAAPRPCGVSLFRQREDEFRAKHLTSLLLGYASVSNLSYEFMGRREVIRPGAFANRQAVIECRLNHRPEFFLGSTRANLFTWEDDHGLLVVLTCGSILSEHAADLLRAGEIGGMSIGRCGRENDYVCDERNRDLAAYETAHIEEVSFVDRAVNRGTAAICLRPSDCPIPDVVEEKRLAAKCDNLARQPFGWADTATEDAKRQLSTLRLERLAYTLILSDVFTARLDARNELIREAMYSL